MSNKTSAIAVANAFLDIEASDASSFPPIDQMKIQKLVFYAHAWYLAINDKPLFEEDVQAWTWGPVVPDVYLAFKHCKRSPIGSLRAKEFIPSDKGGFLGQPPSPSEDIQTFLRAVWETHKSLTGVQLSNATHNEGEPWTIVKNTYPTLDDKPRIPNELIQNVFKSKIQRSNSDNASTSVNAESA